MSKAKAFFGDLLHKRPVVTPTKTGAEKVAVISTQAEQEEFALRKISDSFQSDESFLLFLQYTDNLEYIKNFSKEIATSFPECKIKIQPLSLTTGVHTGPGTWGIAFIPSAN